ncbi:MAG: hypothetical protein NVS9B1_17040 [Candidatus Dormibacteraceae bacterium]
MIAALLLAPAGLTLLAALTCLLPTGLRAARGPWLRLAIVALLVAALALELVAGSRIGAVGRSLFHQDRFALFTQAAILVAAVVATLLGTGEGLRRLGLLLLSGFGAMIAALAADAVFLWLGLALGVVPSAFAAGGAGRLRLRRPPPELLLVVAAGVGLGLLSAAAGHVPLVAIGVQLGHLSGNRVSAIAGLLIAVGATLALAGLANRSSPVAAAAAVIVILKLTGTAVAAASIVGPPLAIVAAGAMLSAGIGSLAGGPARNLLAWAGLLQLGWIVAGTVGGARLGAGAALFVLGAYLIAATAGPLSLGEAPHGVAGLAERGTARAFGFVVCVVSLAGLPPLPGFFGDFLVAAQLAQANYFWLVAAGFLGGAMVAFAVLRDLRLAYLASSGEQVARGDQVRLVEVGAVVAAILIIGYGFFANPISGLAVQGAAAVGLR